jgi:uncharacterized protein (DUF885 family)
MLITTEKKMKKITLLMTITALLMPISVQAQESNVSSTPATTSRRETPEGKRLFALLKAADEEDLSLIPQNALMRGDLRFAGDFGDLISDDFFSQAKKNLQLQLSRLSTIKRAQLNREEQIAHDVFKYTAQYALRQHTEGHTVFNKQMPIDHIFGQHMAFAQLSSGNGAAVYKTAADYEAGLGRIDGFVIYINRAITRMREGLRDGRVQPTFIVKKILAQLDTELASDITASPYFQPIQSLSLSLSTDEKAQFSTQYKHAIEQKIRPALKQLRDFILSDYLPASRSDNPGLSSAPNGVKYYEYILESHTTTRLSAEKIHQLGLKEVARIGAEMAQIKKQVGFSGTHKAFIAHLQTDPQFQYKSKEDLIAAYQTVQQKIEALLPLYFKTLAQTPTQIKPVPVEQESSAGGAYYIVGTPDGSRPGIFYINTSNLPTRTSLRTTALFLHEGVPGHHLQASLANENAALPALLRFGWSTGFGEGWALYAEMLGKEMGLYTDPYQYFGRLDMEMLRAVRLVVDTGLHAKKWSRQQAMDTMLMHTTLDAAAVEQEIDRYIVWPGQATAYKVGELFIRDLRTKAQRVLGQRFDLRAFHDEVLNTGAIPLDVLQKKIDSWVAQLKNKS